MSNWFIAFIGAIGFGGWIYAKVNRKSGGNTKNSLVVAVIAGAFVFIIMLTLLGALDNYLKR